MTTVSSRSPPFWQTDEASSCAPTPPPPTLAALLYRELIGILKVGLAVFRIANLEEVHPGLGRVADDLRRVALSAIRGLHQRQMTVLAKAMQVQPDVQLQDSGERRP